ncbi:hypothetical protein CURE108131_23020 [Cupriavidus respiraculi]|uniref:Coil containing protein n=1 Tax=Cupriavidus respiraculi TaxID=195930 RepID=A0ABM8WY40_9BURK|nr:hypothetical protein [Cupriavidus respiraculi]CAG9172489.1 hypothetical protein LMG21510_01991 [Cupriavidus respiraculi]
MKVWITKYALSVGLYQAEAERCSSRMIEVRDSSVGLPQYFHGAEWHEDRDVAVAQCEAMRNKKLESLRKQIAKLEKLTFGEQA